jgi:hypothetical protein
MFKKIKKNSTPCILQLLFEFQKKNIAEIHGLFQGYFPVSPFAVYITVDKRIFSNNLLKTRLFLQKHVCSFLR